MRSRAQPKGHIKQQGPKTGLQSKKSTAGVAGKQGSHALTPRPLTAWRETNNTSIKPEEVGILQEKSSTFNLEIMLASASSLALF